jgi:membrane protein YqaA with SNARE-associated domain
MRPLFFLLLLNPLWTWVHRLGGPGLILLGLADNSIIPLPGSMDAFVVLLSAHYRTWWPYYAFMATLGAVLGGYATYRLAEKGGKETLEKKVGKQKAQKVYRRFERHGFSTIVVGAILPPPVPFVPFLMAAGVLRYPHKKFLAALSAGRSVRYFGLAYVGHIYGTAIIRWLSRYYQPLLYAVIALGIIGGCVALFYFKHGRKNTRPVGPAASRAKVG